MPWYLLINGAEPRWRLHDTVDSADLEKSLARVMENGVIVYTLASRNEGETFQSLTINGKNLVTYVITEQDDPDPARRDRGMRPQASSNPSSTVRFGHAARSELNPCSEPSPLVKDRSLLSARYRCCPLLSPSPCPRHAPNASRLLVVSCRTGG